MDKIHSNYYGEDFSELRITSALDWNRYKDMKKQDVLEFILKDCLEYVKKFVSDEWQDAVHIIAMYDVVDSYLNMHDRVIAKLVYAKELGIDGEIEKIVKNR